ncbi:MAG: hypothetical protein AAGF47_12800 [Planctomycetota bacterium]
MIAVWGAGCVSPTVPRTPERATGPTERTVLGDWNDLEAAISRASPGAAVAPLRMDEADGVARFDLLGIDAQPASVVFTAERDWSVETGPVPIRVSATFGTPSDDGRAARLAAAVAEELETLGGVDYAP